jgi:hypothetical protein
VAAQGDVRCEKGSHRPGFLGRSLATHVGNAAAFWAAADAYRRGGRPRDDVGCCTPPVVQGRVVGNPSRATQNATRGASDNGGTSRSAGIVRQTLKSAGFLPAGISTACILDGYSRRALRRDSGPRKERRRGRQALRYTRRITNRTFSGSATHFMSRVEAENPAVVRIGCRLRASRRLPAGLLLGGAGGRVE